jgi:hypothetical protein
MAIHGDWRQIIGWDLADEQIVSWVFGTHGGHGKAVWCKDGDTWKAETKTLLNRWGKSWEFGYTTTMIDENTMKTSSLEKGDDGEPKWSTILKRVKTDE